MPTQGLTIKDLPGKLFEAAKEFLGPEKFKKVKKFLRAESQKLAITLRMIVEGVANGEISKAEAKILLNAQKVATASVLTAAEGMSAVVVESAINAGLKVVKDFVNERLGFPLL
jgi:hypothetical protein